MRKILEKHEKCQGHLVKLFGTHSQASLLEHTHSFFGAIGVMSWCNVIKPLYITIYFTTECSTVTVERRKEEGVTRANCFISNRRKAIVKLVSP